MWDIIKCIVGERTRSALHLMYGKSVDDIMKREESERGYKRRDQKQVWNSGKPAKHHKYIDHETEMVPEYRDG